MTAKKAQPSPTNGATTEVTSKRRAYRRERESALRELDAKLDKLKRELLDATAGTRQDLDGAMKALGAKRRRFVEKLAGLRDASGDAWKDLRKGVDNSWDELEDAYRDLRKGFGSAVGRFKKDSPS